MTPNLYYNESSKLKIITGVLLGSSFIFLTLLNIILLKYTKFLTDFIQIRTRFYERARLVCKKL